MILKPTTSLLTMLLVLVLSMSNAYADTAISVDTSVPVVSVFESCDDCHADGSACDQNSDHSSTLSSHCHTSIVYLLTSNSLLDNIAVNLGETEYRFSTLAHQPSIHKRPPITA